MTIDVEFSVRYVILLNLKNLRTSRQKMIDFHQATGDQRFQIVVQEFNLIISQLEKMLEESA